MMVFSLTFPPALGCHLDVIPTWHFAYYHQPGGSVLLPPALWPRQMLMARLWHLLPCWPTLGLRSWSLQCPSRGQGHALEMACSRLPWLSHGWTQATNNSVTPTDVFVSSPRAPCPAVSHTEGDAWQPAWCHQEPAWPEECCQVVLASRSLGAQWLPDTCAGLAGSERCRGTYASASRGFPWLSPLQLRSVFWAILFTRCIWPSLCNCGNWKGSLDSFAGFMAVSATKYWWVLCGS